MKLKIESQSSRRSNPKWNLHMSPCRRSSDAMTFSSVDTTTRFLPVFWVWKTACFTFPMYFWCLCLTNIINKKLQKFVHFFDWSNLEFLQCPNTQKKKKKGDMVSETSLILTLKITQKLKLNWICRRPLQIKLYN